MQFDYDVKFASTANVAPAVAALMSKAWLANRAAGRNVQFIRETDGRRDEFSFANDANRDRFVASLVAKGVEYAVSQ